MHRLCYKKYITLMHVDFNMTRRKLFFKTFFGNSLYAKHTQINKKKTM